MYHYLFRCLNVFFVGQVTLFHVFYVPQVPRFTLFQTPILPLHFIKEFIYLT